MKTENKSDYLFVDDLLEGNEPISWELLKSMPLIKAKVIRGTIGEFEKDSFEKVMGD